MHNLDRLIEVIAILEMPVALLIHGNGGVITGGILLLPPRPIAQTVRSILATHRPHYQSQVSHTLAGPLLLTKKLFAKWRFFFVNFSYLFYLLYLSRMFLYIFLAREGELSSILFR